jgi:hypothetical protein
MASLLLLGSATNAVATINMCLAAYFSRPMSLYQKAHELPVFRLATKCLRDSIPARSVGLYYFACSEFRFVDYRVLGPFETPTSGPLDLSEFVSPANDRSAQSSLDPPSLLPAASLRDLGSRAAPGGVSLHGLALPSVHQLYVVNSSAAHTISIATPTSGLGVGVADAPAGPSQPIRDSPLRTDFGEPDQNHFPPVDEDELGEDDFEIDPETDPVQESPPVSMAEWERAVRLIKVHLENSTQVTKQPQSQLRAFIEGIRTPSQARRTLVPAKGFGF